MDWPSHRHHLQKDPRLAATLMEPIDQHLHGHAPGADLSDLGKPTKTTRESTGKMLMLWSKDQLISWFHGKFHGKVEKYADFMENIGKNVEFEAKIQENYSQTSPDSFGTFHGLTMSNQT